MFYYANLTFNCSKTAWHSWVAPLNPVVIGPEEDDCDKVEEEVEDGGNANWSSIDTTNRSKPLLILVTNEPSVCFTAEPKSANNTRTTTEVKQTLLFPEFDIFLRFPWLLFDTLNKYDFEDDDEEGNTFLLFTCSIVVTSENSMILCNSNVHLVTLLEKL